MNALPIDDNSLVQISSIEEDKTDLWESTIAMNDMQKRVIQNSTPKKPSTQKSEAEKQQEQAKEKEEEKKAIIEARNELLTPENVGTL